jgi:hypothetical protein
MIKNHLNSPLQKQWPTLLFWVIIHLPSPFNHFYRSKNMKKVLLMFLFGLMTIGMFSTTFAADAAKGSKEEAQALVKAIVAFHKANGREKAIAEGNNPTGKFRKKDLYIFAYSAKGVNLIHSNPKFIGQTLFTLTDANGMLFIQEIIKVGDSASGSGWVKYKWPNPITKVVEPKNSYVEKFEDIYYACGYFI